MKKLILVAVILGSSVFSSPAFSHSAIAVTVASTFMGPYAAEVDNDLLNAAIEGEFSPKLQSLLSSLRYDKKNEQLRKQISNDRGVDIVDLTDAELVDLLINK
jgi:hypothetical protein